MDPAELIPFPYWSVDPSIAQCNIECLSIGDTWSAARSLEKLNPYTLMI